MMVLWEVASLLHGFGAHLPAVLEAIHLANRSRKPGEGGGEEEGC